MKKTKKFLVEVSSKKFVALIVSMLFVLNIASPILAATQEDLLGPATQDMGVQEQAQGNTNEDITDKDLKDANFTVAALEQNYGVRVVGHQQAFVQEYTSPSNNWVEPSSSGHIGDFVFTKKGIDHLVNIGLLSPEKRDEIYNDIRAQKAQSQISSVTVSENNPSVDAPVRFKNEDGTYSYFAVVNVIINNTQDTAYVEIDKDTYIKLATQQATVSFEFNTSNIQTDSNINGKYVIDKSNVKNINYSEEISYNSSLEQKVSFLDRALSVVHQAMELAKDVIDLVLNVFFPNRNNNSDASTESPAVVETPAETQPQQAPATDPQVVGVLVNSYENIANNADPSKSVVNGNTIVLLDANSKALATIETQGLNSEQKIALKNSLVEATTEDEVRNIISSQGASIKSITFYDKNLDNSTLQNQDQTASNTDANTNTNTTVDNTANQNVNNSQIKTGLQPWTVTKRTWTENGIKYTSTSKTQLEYDANGNLIGKHTITEKTWTKNGIKYKSTGETQIKYDKNGNPISKHTTYTVEYKNKKGNKIKKVTEQKLKIDKNGTVSGTKTVTTYKNGKKSSSTKYEVSGKVKITKDGNGKKIKEVWDLTLKAKGKKAIKIHTEWIKKGKGSEYTKKVDGKVTNKTTNDGNGNITINGSKVTVPVCETDSNGNAIFYNKNGTKLGSISASVWNSLTKAQKKKVIEEFKNDGKNKKNKKSLESAKELAKKYQNINEQNAKKGYKEKSNGDIVFYDKKTGHPVGTIKADMLKGLSDEQKQNVIDKFMKGGKNKKAFNNALTLCQNYNIENIDSSKSTIKGNTIILKDKSGKVIATVETNGLNSTQKKDLKNKLVNAKTVEDIVKIIEKGKYSEKVRSISLFFGMTDMVQISSEPEQASVSQQAPSTTETTITSTEPEQAPVQQQTARTTIIDDLLTFVVGGSTVFVPIFGLTSEQIGEIAQKIETTLLSAMNEQFFAQLVNMADNFRKKNESAGSSQIQQASVQQTQSAIDDNNQLSISGESTFVKNVSKDGKNYLVFQNGNKMFAIESEIEFISGTLSTQIEQKVIGDVNGIPVIEPQDVTLYDIVPKANAIDNVIIADSVR